jgi:hypothetical protein
MSIFNEANELTQRLYYAESYYSEHTPSPIDSLTFVRGDNRIINNEVCRTKK